VTTLSVFHLHRRSSIGEQSLTFDAEEIEPAGIGLLCRSLRGARLPFVPPSAPERSNTDPAASLAPYPALR
jgi:hypothetical protein